MATPAATESYMDVQKLIYNIVWKFKRRYGGDFDELLSVANEKFAIVYSNHDPNYAKQHPEAARFTTWLQIKVWRSLQDHLQKQIRHSQRGCCIDDDLLDEVDAKEDTWTGLLVDLSDDARQVVGLICQPPPDISCEVRLGKRGASMKRAVADFLRDIGWAAARIAETFHEISEALG